jgi:phenylalanyl-tRNA synthetase beta chain
MKVVVSWLRELCPTDLGIEDLAERLTQQGVKVEAILRPWERLGGVLVARVVEVRDHPDSDKLCLARVSTGAGEREVVVGVRNMKAGDLVPLAGPGATVPGLPEPLAARKIRGVVSDGMLCSPNELGISPDHQGILILPPATQVGADFGVAFGLDDAVFDIEVKSNRPDLMSVIGVAREASAATGAPVVPPIVAFEEGEEKAHDAASVEVLDTERCPRYLARVITGAALGSSPITVQARLTASGMRPLSNMIDATNYVMLELGQPLHPFDLRRLEGAAVVVRRAGRGERLVTLDKVERELTEEDLLIADREKGIAIAGVMGSAAAEVSASTTDILLESAHFQPRGVLRTARRLGLRTEASMRFERGSNPEAVGTAADRATGLIAEWAGGTVLAGAVEVGHPGPRHRVGIRPHRASKVLGYPVSKDEVLESLHRLGIEASADEDSVETVVPSYRWDLQLEEDLIEEVARVKGYDRVPESLPAVRQEGGMVDSYALRRRIRGTLVRAGLREAFGYSFASSTDLALMRHRDDQGILVANPLAVDQRFLRTSLIPGLVNAVAHNFAHGSHGVALFEVGRVFERGDPVEERERVALAVGGRSSSGFPGEAREMDFFDAKGAVETLMRALSVRTWSLGDPPGEPFHPARSALVMVGGERAGVIGELHPRVAERFDLPVRTAVAELDVAAVMPQADGGFSFREIPRLPAVHRDLAFVLDESVPAGSIQAAIAEDDLVDSVELFDVYTGEPIPAGRKSLAFSVDFRAPERTLTDDEADSAVERIVLRLATEFGAELRAG